MKLHRYVYTLGDWSGDGHEKTEVFTLESSHESSELLNAYRKGVEIIGYDILEYAQEYEDFEIDPIAAESFEKLGVEFDMDGDVYYLHHEIMLDAFIATIKQGDPTILIEIVDGDEDLVHTFGSMGYGCFS